jgi:hypothetical protein
MQRSSLPSKEGNWGRAEEPTKRGISIEELKIHVSSSEAGIQRYNVGMETPRS